MFISRQGYENLAVLNPELVDISTYPGLKVSIDGCDVTSLFLCADNDVGFVSFTRLDSRGRVFHHADGMSEIFHIKGEVTIDLGDRDRSGIDLLIERGNRLG